MMPAVHLESALQHLQRILIVASRPKSPITRQEALEQVAEELELAGFGSPETHVASIADPEARRNRLQRKKEADERGAHPLTS